MHTEIEQQEENKSLMNIGKLVLLAKRWLTVYLKVLTKSQAEYWNTWVNLK